MTADKGRSEQKFTHRGEQKSTKSLVGEFTSQTRIVPSDEDTFAKRARFFSSRSECVLAEDALTHRFAMRFAMRSVGPSPV